MADTVYHEHVAPAADTDSSGMWFILGLVFLIVFLVLAFGVFGAGNWFRGIGAGTGSTNSVNVPIPDKVDVNVNK